MSQVMLIVHCCEVSVIGVKKNKNLHAFYDMTVSLRVEYKKKTYNYTYIYRYMWIGRALLLLIK